MHTHIGDTAIGSEVNGKNLPLETILKNGDMIKINTKKESPSLHWLSSKTGKARAAIRRYCKIEVMRFLKIKQNIQQHSLIDLPHKLYA